VERKHGNFFCTRKQLTIAVHFRIRRSYLVLGILCTAAIAALGGFSVIVAALNLDGSFRYPLPTAVGLGCFWGRRPEPRWILSLSAADGCWPGLFLGRLVSGCGVYDRLRLP